MKIEYSNNMASITWSNIKLVEEEINTNYDHLEDFLVLAEITPYSYYPIESTIDSEGYMRLADSPQAIEMKLYLCSKRQFLHKRIVMEEDSYKIELDESLKTAWDSSKFVIFQDGYLMNSNLFTYIIPNFSNTYLKKVIYSTAKFRKNSRIDIYYIESDDFFRVPISKDVYLSSLKYTAIINNDRIIPIPYPSTQFEKNSFFVFNEEGEYLDERIDYIVSADGKYLTLSEEKQLKLANVDYIVFAFIHLPNNIEFIEYEKEVPFTLDGAPMFTYAYSIPYSDQSGLVRFSPMFNDYPLSKKNFLIFGNGQFITPDRYEINGNDSIIFIKDEDKIQSMYINYTMIIFNDNTSHDEIQIPSEYYLLPIEMENTNYALINGLKIDPKFKSYIVIKDGYLVNSNDYVFDEEQMKITFNYNVDGTIYVLFVSSIVNNTKQDAVVESYNFPCNRYGTLGTPIPLSYRGRIWSDKYLLLFLNGAFLEPSLYEVRDNTIYLDSSFYMDDMGNPITLEGYTFSIVYIIGLLNYKQTMLNEDEINRIEEEKTLINDQYQEGNYLQIRQSSRKQNRGVVMFNDSFSDYKLTKRNFLLFSNGGTWIDPTRFSLVSNNELYFLYDFDQNKAIYNIYNMVILNDVKDENYSPSNFLIKQVLSTNDNQSIFEIPKVHRRFKTFLLFKGSMLLSRDFRYKIDEKENTVTLLEDFDYLSKDRNLTFIFLDAHSRQGHENLLVQANFEYDLSKSTTKIPTNFLISRFNPKYMMLFLNGLYIDPTKYKIIDNEILLDGFIDISAFNTPIYTIVYIATLPSYLQTYDYILPKEPDIPISPINSVGNAYWTKLTSEDSYGKIVKFTPIFDKYFITKQNFLLFGNEGIWINPSLYDVYDNNTLIIKDPEDNNYTMAIFNDAIKHDDPTVSPIATKTIDVGVRGSKIIEIPDPGEDYRSFIVFYNGRLINLSKYKVDMNERKIYLKKSLSNKFFEKVWSFVFINAHMNAKQETLLVQEDFTYEGKDTPIPTSIFDENRYNPKYLLLFYDGLLLTNGKYRENGGKLTIEGAHKGESITALYLISLIVEDYSDEYIIERPSIGVVDGFHLDYYHSSNLGDDNQIIQFVPSFNYYNLTSNNFLLFGNGTWISPERYIVQSNSIIEFTNQEDIEKELTNYTMVVLNEGNVEDNTYTPIHFTLYKVTATEDQQRLFNLPPMNEHSSYLIFLGSLFVPLDDERLYFTDDNKLVLIEEDDFVDKDRSLYFLVLNDSSASDRRYPILVQETFEGDMDPRRGSLLPSKWHTEEEFLMIFMNGIYLDRTRYDIRDHMIYLLDDFSEMESPFVNISTFIKRRMYTVVYTVAHVLDDYTETTVVPIPIEEPIEPVEERVIPDDDIDIDTGYKMVKYTSIMENEIEEEEELEEERDYVYYLDAFHGYPLDKNNFLLFANGTWIHPDRFEVIDNTGIKFISEEDMEHSKNAHYNIIFPLNKEALNIYGESTYARVEFKVVNIYCEFVTRELEIPPVEEEFESLLIFRNSIIVPINDEDRFVLDEDNHKFTILNMNDYIPAGSTLNFVYMKSTTNTDQKILLIQESFLCYGYETVIPKTAYTYNDQVFYKDKMILFLNGTYVDNERYTVHNNIIYLKDDDYQFDSTYLYTLVYLDIRVNEESELSLNVIDDNKFDKGLDDVIVETAYAKPYKV